jgi:hypothetical protein
VPIRILQGQHSHTGIDLQQHFRHAETVSISAMGRDGNTFKQRTEPAL